MDARTKYGQTAVWMATWYGHAACLAALVKAGADANLSDGCETQGVKFSPLEAAVLLKRTACGRILANAGVHVDCSVKQWAPGQDMLRVITEAATFSLSARCSCSYPDNPDSCGVAAGIEVYLCRCLSPPLSSFVSLFPYPIQCGRSQNCH